MKRLNIPGFKLQWPVIVPAQSIEPLQPLWRRLLWMAGIWLLSIGLLLLVAGVLRWVLRQPG
jgi:hypothetical protein